MLRFFYSKEDEEKVPVVYRKKIPIIVYMSIMLIVYFLVTSFFRYRSDPDRALVFMFAVFATSMTFLVALFLVKFRYYQIASYLATLATLLNAGWTGFLLPVDHPADLYRLAMYIIGSIIGNSMVALHKRQTQFYTVVSMGFYSFITLTHFSSSLGGFEGPLRQYYITTMILMAAINFTVLLIERLNTQLITDIQSYSDHLEEMVETRTEQLAESNTQLIKRQKEMERNLWLAQRIQHNILPGEKTYPQRKELKFGSRYHSLDAIGGDFFDIIRMGKNSYGFLIADVSGHGVPAAMITTMAKVSFNSNSAFETSPGEICRLVNLDIFKLLGGEMSHYLTAYLGVLDLETGTFKYTNAGHHPTVLFRADTQEMRRLGSPGPFLGFSEDVEFPTEETKLEPGDKLLLFTDGIIEAMNNEREMYDYERFLKFIQTHSNLPAKDFVDGLLESVQAFCGSAPPDDDRAVLLIHYLGDSEVVIQEAQTVKAEKSEWKELLREAVDLAKSSRLQESVDLLESLYARWPEKAKIAHVYSTILYKMGKYARAKEVITEALVKNENDYDLNTLMVTLNKKIATPNS